MIGLVGFYGISTIVGYLRPNPLYTYILNIYDLVWLGLNLVVFFCSLKIAVDGAPKFSFVALRLKHLETLSEDFPYFKEQHNLPLCSRE